MYCKPATLGEAIDTLAGGTPVILSGGTDLFPPLANGASPPKAILDISGIEELGRITVGAGHIRIGAGATWSAIAEAHLDARFDGLKAAARQVGSVQIQNRGTIGGNICNASPAADGVPPLLTLDASVELASRAGGVRSMPLSSFIQGNRKTERRPDEILTAIIVPAGIEDGRAAFLKLGARHYLVISIAMVAAIVEADEAGRVAEARVAVGACSAVAQRLPALEAALAGAPARKGLGALAMPSHLSALTPLSDVRASASYRLDAALTLVRRALDACVAEA
jgi:CO/xanthine dehydrogenase FAD-binding subunit